MHNCTALLCTTRIMPGTRAITRQPVINHCPLNTCTSWRLHSKVPRARNSPASALPSFRSQSGIMHSHIPRSDLALRFAINLAFLAALALSIAILVAVRHEEWKDEVYENCPETPESRRAGYISHEGYRCSYDPGALQLLPDCAQLFRCTVHNAEAGL